MICFLYQVVMQTKRITVTVYVANSNSTRFPYLDVREVLASQCMDSAPDG